MRCISPLLIRSDGRRDVVPCGKCNFCLETKRGDWSFRLFQEMKSAFSADFLTLTYDESTIPVNSSGLPELCKEDFQLFMKRLRKENALSTTLSLRYYAVGEYGTETCRPHYHAIMFNLNPDLVNKLPRIWKKGLVHRGDVTPASIHYTTKYVINRHQDFGDRAPPFCLMSRRPGLGVAYLDTHAQWHKAGLRNYAKVNGMTTRLPRYYKDKKLGEYIDPETGEVVIQKLFTTHEKQKLRLEGLQMSDEQYLKEIERLSKLHPDPFAYYEERITHAHDKVTSKINVTNTI